MARKFGFEIFEQRHASRSRIAKLGFASVLSTLAFGVVAQPAAADQILFDRGLPTTNLNNAAGGNRSNVAWGEAAAGEVSPFTNSVGENFTLGGNSIVNTIQVWVIDNSTTAPSAGAYKLWMGADTGASSTVSDVATSTSVTLVTYSGGASY